MTVVTLSALLSARDESLAVKSARPAWFTRVRAWLRQVPISAVTARVMMAVVTLAGFTFRHGLVLAGLGAFVIGAASMSPLAGWIVAGVSLLFLEVRRR